ncbi:LOW QUALITY PROTEIN: b(0,+)-type amino acid transporter 1-like [Eumetopias jubatus]|uniref:LOW QUALITY PROTEIN: b(0,+)-type amino acid transporter 1-like n=1 Tax=Eumetopias jubatus TaxID=34886 RepID=UPI001015DEE9|nr:LOW QUALITY PROTEIN: b(0,+)-type amino acid transporter 1-like [Eumetopias jubatus]
MERSQERDGGEGVAGWEPGGGGLRLRREIGLWSAVSLIAGCVIGSGIFMSPQGVLVYIGSPGPSLVVWAVCGVLAMMGALCYAELGALVPKSGGEYAYILHIFGSLPAFLVIYTFVLLVRPAAIAAVSLSFAEYAVAPFYPGCSSMPQAVLKGVATILLLMLVNCWSSRLATMLMNVCTVAAVFSLLVIMGGGAVVLGQGHGYMEAFLFAFHNTTQQAGCIGMAFYQGLWSFDGWNNVNYGVEELKKPKQNLVWALMIAIPLVTSLYLRVNISYLLVLSPNEILSSDAMAVSWGNQVLGAWAWLVPLAVTLSTFGSVNGTFFGGSRVCYVAAREGHMPQLLSMVDVHRLTPTAALTFTTAGALVLVLPGNCSTIVNFLSFLGWITYGTTVGCLLYLRIKKRNLPRPYKVPTLIPVIMLLASLYLVLAPVIDHPQVEFLYIFLFLFSGIPVYLLLVYFQCQPEWLQMATLYLQLLLEVAPTMRNVD